MENPQLQALAQRMAQACRHVIDGVLYEWEIMEVEEEFFSVILAGLKEINESEQERSASGNAQPHRGDS